MNSSRYECPSCGTPQIVRCYFGSLRKLHGGDLPHAMCGNCESPLQFESQAGFGGGLITLLAVIVGVNTRNIASGIGLSVWATFAILLGLIVVITIATSCYFGQVRQWTDTSS